MDRIELLKVFIAVVETGTFTAAAERLGMTPQLVSKYIRMLEDQLGAQLFVRSTRNVRLTETGTGCLESCRRLLEDFDQLVTGIRQEHLGPQGCLRVSAPTTFGEQYLVPLLPEFSRAYPGIAIDLNLTDRYVNLLEEGYDVALRIGVLEDSSLKVRKLARAPIWVCASANFLATQGQPSEPEELLNYPCIVDTNFRDREIWQFSKGNKTQRIKVADKIRVNSANAVRDLLLADMGIALCPAYVVEKQIKSKALECLFADYDTGELGIYAAYVENRYLSAKIRAFIDFLLAKTAWKF